MPIGCFESAGTFDGTSLSAGVVWSSSIDVSVECSVRFVCTVKKMTVLTGRKLL